MATQKTQTIFVARATTSPQEDLDRNWTAYGWGVSNNNFHTCECIEDARTMWERETKEPFIETNWRYHNFWDGYCEVQCLGLAAYKVNKPSLQEAITAAERKYGNRTWDMKYKTRPPGSGHFLAEQCIAFHPTSFPSLWIYEVCID